MASRADSVTFNFSLATSKILTMKSEADISVKYPIIQYPMIFDQTSSTYHQYWTNRTEENNYC